MASKNQRKFYGRLNSYKPAMHPSNIHKLAIKQPTNFARFFSEEALTAAKIPPTDEQIANWEKNKAEVDAMLDAVKE